MSPDLCICLCESIAASVDAGVSGQLIERTAVLSLFLQNLQECYLDMSQEQSDKLLDALCAIIKYDDGKGGGCKRPFLPFLSLKG